MMQRSTIGSVNSRDILREKQTPWNGNRKQAVDGVQVNTISIAGLSSQSAMDDSRGGKNGLDSMAPHANDILQYLNDVMKKGGYCLHHKQKHDLPYGKHYELAYVFPYSEDRLNISHTSKLPTGIANMLHGSIDSKMSNEYLRRTFARMMLGVHDPKAKSCEAVLQAEEQKLAENPSHSKNKLDAINRKIRKRLKRNETESFFKSKMCMVVSPFYKDITNAPRTKRLTYEEMKTLMQNKLKLRLLCAYRFLKLLEEIRSKRNKYDVQRGETLLEAIRHGGSFNPSFQNDVKNTRKYVYGIFFKTAPTFDRLPPSLVKDLVGACRKEFSLKDKVGNGQEQHALYLESLWNAGRKNYRFFLVSQLQKLRKVYDEDASRREKRGIQKAKPLKIENSFQDDWHTVIRKILDHNLCVLILLLAVTFTLILVGLEFTFDTESDAKWIPVANLVCSVLFTIEVLIRMFAMGIWNTRYNITCLEILSCIEVSEERNESEESPGYFQDMFCLTDFIVTILDWIAYLATRVFIQDSSTKSAASLIVAFRFVRILRVLRMAGGIKKAKQLASIAKKLPFVKELEYDAMETFGLEYLSFVRCNEQFRKTYKRSATGRVNCADSNLHKIREFNLLVAYTVANRIYKVCGLNVRVKLLPGENQANINGLINAKKARLVIYVGANTSRLKTIASSLNYRIQTMNRPLIKPEDFNTKKVLSERLPNLELHANKDLTTSPTLDVHLWKKRSHIELYNTLARWGHTTGDFDDTCVGENETYFAPYLPYDSTGPLHCLFRLQWNDNCCTFYPQDRKTFGSTDRVSLILQEMKRHINMDYLMGKVISDYVIMGDKWVHRFSTHTGIQKITQNLGETKSKRKTACKNEIEKSVELCELGDENDNFQRILNNIQRENTVKFFKFLLKSRCLKRFIGTASFRKCLDDPDKNIKEVIYIIGEWFKTDTENSKKKGFRQLSKIMAQQKLGNWAKHLTLRDIGYDLLVACIPVKWLFAMGFDQRKYSSKRLTQPALQLKWYFGTDVSLYYLWLAKYIKHLQLPALAGLTVYILQLLTGDSRVKDVAARARVICAAHKNLSVDTNYSVVKLSTSQTYSSDEYFYSTFIFFGSTLVYCGLIYLWSMDFASTWEGYEKRFALLFGYTESGHKDEKLEPHFNFNGVTTRNEVTDELEMDYEDKLIWRCNLWFSKTTMLLLLVIVLTSVVALIFLKVLMDAVLPTYGVIVVGLIQGVVIVILDILWKSVAKFLTEIENHKYIEEYQKSIIRKTFLFSFINSYISIAYIAFFKSIVDPCSCIPKLDCVGEAHTQLLTIFVSRLIVQNSIEHIHKFAACFKACCTKNEGEWKEDHDLNIEMNNCDPYTFDVDQQAMSELDRAPYEFKEHFDNFNEIVINHGYWMLFGAIFPIGSLATLVLNTVELRLDAYSMWTDFRRPDPMSEDEVVVWKELLNLVSFISIISNSILVIYTADIEIFRIAQPTLKLVFLLAVCTGLGTIFFLTRASYYSNETKNAKTLLKRFQHFGNKIQGKLYVDEDAESFGTTVRETEDETLRRRKRQTKIRNRNTMK